METNADIRAAIKRAGVRYWQVADALGIHEGMLSRRLRRELPPKEKAVILQAIEKAKGELKV